jgi:hypothetical protein
MKLPFNYLNVKVELTKRYIFINLQLIELECNISHYRLDMA